MKLLSLVWFQVLPARFGGQKGTALFNEYLGRKVPLVCLCSRDNQETEGLSYRLRPELPTGKSQVLRPAVWRDIRRVVAEEAPTHIILEYPYHAVAAVRAKKRFGLPLVLHAHNIEYLRFRALGKPGWTLLKRYERWACRQADLVLFKTEDDRRKAISGFGIEEGKTMIVPYGIEPGPAANSSGIRAEYGIGDDERLLLFAGTLDYAPNAAAVEEIYRELAPRLDASGISYRILVCGRNRDPRFDHLRKLSHPRVTQTGEVPDLRPFYSSADLFINPVLSGGGVQTKIIDALAQHCSVVTFNFGASGIVGQAGLPLHLVADGDWSEFADMAANAATTRQPLPEAFLDYYSWEGIAGRVSQRLNEL